MLPEIALHTTDVIREQKTPAHLLNLRSFLWICTFLRPFVPNLARSAALLKKEARNQYPSTFQKLYEENFQFTQDL